MRTLVRRGDRRRIERFPQHALARARPLDLGDDRGPAGCYRRADRCREATRRRRRTGIAHDCLERALDLRRNHFLGLRRHDAGEDVPVLHRPLRAFGHAGWPNDWVAATNASSLRIAAPLAIAARARSMPSSTVAAMPAA